MLEKHNQQTNKSVKTDRLLPVAPLATSWVVEAISSLAART
jgi:hypothetical protein